METIAMAMTTMRAMAIAIRWQATKRVMTRAARAMMMAKKRARVTVARAMVMATNEGEGGKGKSHSNKGVGRGMVTSANRAMATVTRVVGDE